MGIVKMTEQQTLKKVFEAQCEIELLVYKLAGGVRSADELEHYTGHRYKNEIPAEQAPRLRRDLEAELRCREVLGEEAYRESRSIYGKIALYQCIFEKATRTLAKAEGDRPVSWAEFRRMVTVEFGRMPDLAQQLRDAFDLGAGQLDETGYTWGRKMTERAIGRPQEQDRGQPREGLYSQGLMRENVDVWREERTG